MNVQTIIENMIDIFIRFYLMIDKVTEVITVIFALGLFVSLMIGLFGSGNRSGNICYWGVIICSLGLIVISIIDPGVISTG